MRRRTARQGTDHGAAGVGVPHRHARDGTDGRRVPRAAERARRRRQRQGDVGLPRRLRSLLEQWLGVDAAQGHPRCVGVPAHSADRVTAAARLPPACRSSRRSSRSRFRGRTIKAGDAIVELVNQGQDAHDLRMQAERRRPRLHLAGRRRPERMPTANTSSSPARTSSGARSPTTANAACRRSSSSGARRRRRPCPASSWVAAESAGAVPEERDIAPAPAS